MVMTVMVAAMTMACVVVTGMVVVIVGMKQTQETTPYSAEGCSADGVDAAGSTGRVKERRSMVGALVPLSR